MEYLSRFFSCVFLLFGAAWVCAHSTHQAMHMNYYQPSKLFIQLVGARKGDYIPGIRDVKSYLHRFGYLSNFEYSTSKVTDDRFDKSLERALLTYQDFHTLNKTGVLDHETISLMSTPRCGNPDIFNVTETKYFRDKFSRHYRFFPGRPHRTQDHLYVVFKENVPPQLVDAITRAFADWEPYVPLVFLKTLEPGGVVPDIRVQFFRGEHGDGHPFDGPRGAIAHASSGTGSALHFDLDENWQVGVVPDALDVATAARHEIGHLLGLDHSSVRSAIMYPSLGPQMVKEIGEDDIAGIKELYFGK